MRSNQTPLLQPQADDGPFAEITAMMRAPLSRTILVRGRYVAGALAAAGSLAMLFGGAHAAEAKTTTTTAPTPARTSVDAAFNYTVRSGDTLSAVAKKNNVSVGAIATINAIKNVHRISVGQQLLIPSTVQKASNTGSRATVTPRNAPKATGLPKASKPSPGQRLPAELQASASRKKLHPQFMQAARAYNVPSDLLQAMAWNESGWSNKMTSSTGAVGVGQLMPDTIQFINSDLLTKPLDPSVPEQNIRMSAAFLRYLMDQTNGDYRLALASYYQGLNSVRTRGLYEDTKQYVQTVAALQNTYF